MEKESAVTFLALNLPKKFSDFIARLESSDRDIEYYNAPEEMVPVLKSIYRTFVVVLNVDVLGNKGHNDVTKYLEFLELDPYITVFPIIALTSKDEKFQQKVWNMKFAAQVISINDDFETSRLKIENTISIYIARHNLEVEVQKSHEGVRRAELQRLYEIDKVTGIYGKEAFCKRTEQLLKENPDKKFVIVRWDVDRFKVFNDTYGVDVGDDFLTYIGAEYIKRKWKTMTYGHWVADHFVMCIDEKLFSGPAIHEYITKVVQSYMPEFEFTVRMGVYRINDSSLPVRLMCDRALLAMDSIKGNYEKRIAYYEDSMLGHLLEEQDLVSDMESALANEDFIVYYQPQYNFASGKMTGAEALVRWNHPEKGMIRPDKFIPLFEQNGFICHLDEYVWESVCKTLRKWIDGGVNVVPISVNISRRDIYNPKLISIITGLIKKYKISPELLRLEITESAYMEDPDKLIKVVDKLKAAGFTVEMDDFGSGYSSLNTLKDVPVDILKLDLKFLISEGENTRGGSILTSVVRMANWLKMPVIAEGIETKTQADFLKSIGCHLMQGYLFSRPIPEPEFKEIMEAAELDVIDDEEDINIQNAVDFMNIKTQNALLFNSFVGGAIIVERDGENVETVRINDQFFEMIGVTREEYKPRSHNTLSGFTSGDAKKFLKMLDDAKETGKEASCDTLSEPINDKHEAYWLRCRARYLASTGNRDLFYVSAENITQRRILHQKNLDLANELSLIMDSVPCGIVKYEQIGETRTLQYVNQYAANIFGRTTEEFVETFSKGDVGLILEEDIPTVNSLKAKAIKNKSESYSAWLRIVKKNGTLGRVYEEARLTFSTKNRKKVVSCTIILVDITYNHNDNQQANEILKKLFDVVFEIDYKNDKVSLIQTSQFEKGLKKIFAKPLSVSDALVPWFKQVIADDYKKQMAKILDVEYIKSMQANNDIPYFEYEIAYGEDHKLQGTLLVQTGESKYLMCTKVIDGNLKAKPKASTKSKSNAKVTPKSKSESKAKS